MKCDRIEADMLNYITKRLYKVSPKNDFGKCWKLESQGRVKIFMDLFQVWNFAIAFLQKPSYIISEQTFLQTNPGSLPLAARH